MVGIVENFAVAAWMGRNCNGDTDDHLADAVDPDQLTMEAVIVAGELIPTAFVKKLQEILIYNTTHRYVKVVPCL